MKIKVLVYSIFLQLFLFISYAQAADINEIEGENSLKSFGAFQGLMKDVPEGELTLEYACQHYNPTWILHHIRIETTQLFHQAENKEKSRDLFYQWLFAQRLHIVLTGTTLENFLLLPHNRQNPKSFFSTLALEEVVKSLSLNSNNSSLTTKTTGKNKKSSGSKNTTSSPQEISLHEYGKMYQFLKEPGPNIDNLKPILDCLGIKQDFLSQFKKIDEKIKQLAFPLVKLLSMANKQDSLKTRASFGLEDALWECLEKDCVEAAKGGFLPAMYKLGIFLFEAGRSKEAKFWLTKAIEISKETYLEIMYNLGIILFQEENLEEAEKWFRKVVKNSKETHANAMSKLANLLVKRKEFKEAEKWSQKAVKISHGLDVDILFSFAYLLSEQQKFEEAEKYLKEAVKVSEGKHIEAIYALGRSLSEQRKFEEAQKHLKMAIAISQETHVGAMQDLGYILAEQGEYQNAEEWYQKSFKVSQERNGVALYNLALILFIQGKKEEAKSYFEEAMRKGLKSSYLFLATMSNDFEEARGYFQEAICCGVENSTFYYLEFLLKQGLMTQEICDELEEESSCPEEEFPHEDPLPIFFDKIPEPLSSHGSKDHHLSAPTHTESSPSLSEVPSSPALSAEKYICPSLTKTMRRIEERTKKAQKRLTTGFFSPKKQLASKTYKDIVISITTEAQSQLNESSFYLKMKIQGLISMLANGEYERNRFKKLKGMNLYSMRITRKDRFVFELPENLTPTGISHIQIVSIKGHYEHLKSGNYVPIKW